MKRDRSYKVRLLPSPASITLAALSVVVVSVLIAAGPAASAPEWGSTVSAELAASPDPVTLGEDLTYTATVTNDGPDSAMDAVVRIGVPEGARFVSTRLLVGSSKLSCPPPDERDAIRCPIGELAVGEKATLRLVVHPTKVGNLQNVATAGAANNRLVTDNPVIDSAVVAPEHCTLVGTEGVDEIVGTPGRDVVCAFGGGDTLRGRGGDDVVYGGSGRDRLYGGEGEDVLRGWTGDDFLYGMNDGDKAVGGPGRDTLGGGTGNDVLDARDGVSGNDVARGGHGEDTVRSDPGDSVRD